MGPTLPLNEGNLKLNMYGARSAKSGLINVGGWFVILKEIG